jgi:citrate synthase
MLEDSEAKLMRPRQLFTGADRRPYVDIGKRR